jgi:hypothetical protein
METDSLSRDKTKTIKFVNTNDPEAQSVDERKMLE